MGENKPIYKRLYVEKVGIAKLLLFILTQKEICHQKNYILLWWHTYFKGSL
jgi:hypothetical protein